MHSEHTTKRNATRLALDCSVVGLSVALLHKGQVFSRRDHSANKQTAQLVPMMMEVLHEAGTGLEAVDDIITTHGPGSFTGIRIGLATVQGMMAARPVPVITLSTLQAVALSAQKQAERFWVMLNAGKGEIYAQLFHVKQAEALALNDIQLLKPSACLAHIAANDMIAGNAASLLPEVAGQFITDCTLPDAAEMVHYVAPPTAAEGLVPLYIRAPDAKLPAAPLAV